MQKYCFVLYFPEKTLDSVETDRDVGSRVGSDNRSDRSRLGSVHHNYGLAQVHEVRVTVLGGRGAYADGVYSFNLNRQKIIPNETVYS